MKYLKEKKILEGEISNEWLEKDIEHLIPFSILDDFAPGFLKRLTFYDFCNV